VRSDGPSVPFLATAPLNSTPRRRRRWRLVAAAAGTGALVAGLVLLIAMPVAQSAPENLTLTNGGGLGTVGQTVTFPHAGILDVTWKVVGGVTATVTFSILTPGGATVYDLDAASGSASLHVGASGPYTFEIYDWLSGTVQVTGTLHYSAPLL
jgi:hypothetical protein